MKKLVIELDKVAYDLLTDKIETANIDLYSTLIQSVQKGTPLPDNATNGDMIKALFNYEIVDDFHYSYVIDIENNGYYVQFDKEWWNAPYKKGENNDTTN